MKIDEAEVEKLLKEAGTEPEEYLYYLLGSELSRGTFQPLAGGEPREVGKNFFEKFKGQLRPTICGKGGPYDMLRTGIASQEELPKMVAFAILTGNPQLAGTTVTTLIAVYLALLLIQTGLAAYCEGYSEA